MASEVFLSYDPSNQLLAADVFEQDHGMSFLAFVRMFIQGKSQEAADFSMLNKKWDYSITEMSRYYLKANFFKKYNSIETGSSASFMN